MDSFDDFKRELKRQFYPKNIKEEIRGRLHRLKQLGSARGYVKEFSTLLLEFPDTSDKDALFLFMDGLQNWAKLDLKRYGVQGLATATTTVESLIDYSTNKDSSRKDKKTSSGKGGRHHVKGYKENKDSASYKLKDKDREMEECYASKPRVKCFNVTGHIGHISVLRRKLLMPYLSLSQAKKEATKVLVVHVWDHCSYLVLCN